MSKYNSIKTTIGGVTFDSKKEAKRYAELKLLQRGKNIFNLELQPKFKILDGVKVDGHRKMQDRYYIADFMYRDEVDQLIVEDTKGFKTPMYQIKKQMFLALFGSKLIFREL